MERKSIAKKNAAERGLQRLGFESFGVRCGVVTDSPEFVERMPALLPPGARPGTPPPAEASFGVFVNGDGSYRVTYQGSRVSADIDLDGVVALLSGSLPVHIALNAPGMIFIHAGVVVHTGRAIVLPGRTMTGKTTMVLELVRAGASYYSDEYAVINRRGLVLPYARPLSIREGATRQVEQSVERIGGVAGTEAARIGAVVFASYRDGAQWTPAKISPGRAALGVLANAVAAIRRSEEVVRTVTRAIDGALLLEGKRGEAAQTTEHILAALDGRSAAHYRAAPSH